MAGDTDEAKEEVVGGYGGRSVLCSRWWRRQDVRRGTRRTLHDADRRHGIPKDGGDGDGDDEEGKHCDVKVHTFLTAV